MGKRLDIPLPKSDLELVLILDKVSHPGNLGAVCRAMMNFGFTKLRLINPQCSPEDEEARNRAKHAGFYFGSCNSYSNQWRWLLMIVN